MRAPSLDFSVVAGLWFTQPEIALCGTTGC